AQKNNFPQLRRNCRCRRVLLTDRRQKGRVEPEMRGHFFIFRCLGVRGMDKAARDVAQWLPAARAGSSEALGEILEACRGYLLLLAQEELDPGLQAKGGASDLVQQTFMEAQQDFARFQGDSEGAL